MQLALQILAQKYREVENSRQPSDNIYTRKNSYFLYKYIDGNNDEKKMRTTMRLVSKKVSNRTTLVITYERVETRVNVDPIGWERIRRRKETFVEHGREICH